MTYILGLTGSMATGKSTVLAMFRDLGVPVISADEVVHALYEAEAVAPLAAAFPGVTANGRVDRQKLSALLVDHPEKLAALEAIVHPLVFEKTMAFVTACREKQTTLAVLEIPLLFETANTYPLDGIAVTWCAPDIQKRRIMARPGMTVDKFETMLARQMPQDEKKKRADFLINTGIPLDETRQQVADIVARIGTAENGPAA